MELDDLKHAWQTLGRQLERQNTIRLRQWQEQRITRARGHLRPLFWGQVLQIASGAALILLGAACWSQHRDIIPLLLAGIVVHVYGVVTIIMAGITLGMIAKLDPAAPVLDIQQRLARLGRFYLINGMVTGLPWWLMYVPVLMALASLSGHDLYTHAPSWFWISVAIGVSGLIGTWIFHRWSRSPKRAELGRRLDEGAMGGSIRRSRAIIDEVARFEREC